MIKTLIVPILLLSATAIYGQTANTYKAITTKPDTIIYYKVDSESMSLKGSEVIYKVNNRIVSKDLWKRVSIGNGQLKTCTPCMVKTYDDKETLLSVGMQYKWCQAGVYTGYYPDGKIKVTGQYKTNTTGKPGKPTSPAFCGVKEGTWTYYSETGEVTKTEVYKNGLPVK